MPPPFARMAGSLQSRLMFSVATLVVLLTVAVTITVNNRMAALLLRETEGRGLAVAHSIGAATANALISYDYLSLRQAADKSIQEEQIAYVVVLDKEGNVAGRATETELDGVIHREMSSSPLSPVRPSAIDFYELDLPRGRVRMMDVAHGIFIDGSDVQWGTVRVGLDLEAMHAEISRVRVLLALLGAGAVLLAILGSRFISRRITASLDELIRGTIAVSRGDLDHRIESDSVDEVAALASHFNHMTAQVRKQQNEIAVAKRQLEVLNSTLEDKVARRTKEFLASEEKYRTLVDSSPDPILIVQEGEVRFVNPAFERIFGQVADGISGVTATDIFHRDDRERARRFVDRVLEGHPGEPGEIRGVTPDGDVRIFEMRGMRIHYLGEPAVEILLMDTTERKELQDSLLQHEKLRALGELASGVAHDFNNTLGIILGRSQLLQRVSQDPEVRRGLRTIERAAFDGGETVRRIQDFARSRTEQNFETIPLNPLLEEIVEITRTRWKDEAEVRDVAIDVQLELGESAHILGNASELREVYTNLIFNAVDALPEGGVIRIRSRVEDGVTVVTVKDNGIGMDEDVRARVFDPFFSTKGTKGLGMGMSVVFGIIDRHDGKITVDSEPGRGTAFHVRIPAANVAVVEEHTPAEESTAARCRVLVVDDEADIAELVTDILEAEGHSVRSALNGPDGLDLFREEPAEVLICDLGMREMSGWEVVKAMRELDPTVGVILLTGWGGTLSEEDVRRHGVDAVMAKPFEMKGLLENLRETQRLRGERRSSAAL